MATRLRRALGSDHAVGWAFAFPAVFLIAVFGLVPIAWSFLLSFQKSNLISPNPPFIGLANYRALAKDPLFRQSVAHTVIYTALFVPFTFAIDRFAYRRWQARQQQQPTTKR